MNLKRYNFFIFFCVIFFFISEKLIAHPHVFINTTINTIVSNRGIEKIEIKFCFDQMFSMDLIQNFDKDKNNSFSNNEILKLEKEAFSNLKEFNYFIHLTQNGKKIVTNNITNFGAKIEEGIVTYCFTINTKIPFLKNSNTIKIAAYDHSFFIAVAIEEYHINKIKNTYWTLKDKKIEDPDQSYYYDQLYPECIVLSAIK